MSSQPPQHDHSQSQPDHHEAGSHQRRTSFSRSPEHRRRSFEIEDARWAAGRQLRDWGILAGMIALTIGWTLLIYFFEPGLR